MDVPEKYFKLHSEGKSDHAIAESLIKDGFGKLRSIAILSRLFGYSLLEANQVFEESGSERLINP